MVINTLSNTNSKSCEKKNCIPLYFPLLILATEILTLPGNIFLPVFLRIPAHCPEEIKLLIVPCDFIFMTSCSLE